MSCYDLDSIEHDMRMILKLRRERRTLQNRLKRTGESLDAISEARVHRLTREIDERVLHHKLRVLRGLEKDWSSLTGKSFAYGVTLLQLPECATLTSRLVALFRKWPRDFGCRCPECSDWRYRFRRLAARSRKASGIGSRGGRDAIGA